MSPIERHRRDAATLRALHLPGDPLVLVNAWDAGSARAVAGAGAPAVATSSWAVAAAHGLDDGELLDLAVVLAVAREVVAAVEVPVSVDLERGFGETPGDVARNVRALAEVGVAGINLEDGLPGDRLRPAAEQAERLRAVRDAVPDLVLNARTDLFLVHDAADHASQLAEAVARGALAAEAGADVFFVPGLGDPESIERVVREVTLPVNVMVTDGDPAVRSALAALGVARISTGPAPYLQAMQALSTATVPWYG